MLAPSVSYVLNLYNLLFLVLFYRTQVFEIMNINFLKNRLFLKIRPSNLFTYIVIMTIGITMAGLWINSNKSFNIPCAADCGEIFDALQYATNFDLYGFKYRLIQDMATSPDLAAHPYFYTHNVNLAGYFFTILEAIGLKSLQFKQLFTLIIFGLGLFYIFETVSFYTSSKLVGFLTLLLFCTDYEHILSFGLNALRAWHWLALFGLLFHIRKIQTSSEKAVNGKIFDYLLFSVFALIAFGLGYDFWLICIFIINFSLLFFLPRPLFSKTNLTKALIIGSIFLIPLVLRQIQIISGLGFHFWVMDLYYSAVIKVSFLNRVFSLPDFAQIDHFYNSFNVLRPPASPTQSLNQTIGTLKDMLINITIPTFGTISTILALILGLISIFLSGARLFSHKNVHCCNNYILKFETIPINLNSAGNFLTSISLGIISGLSFFLPLSLHIYFKHQFPLIAVLFLLPKAIILGIGLHFLLSWSSYKLQKPGRYLMVICIILTLIFDHFWVQYDNYKAKKPLDVSWIGAIEKMPGQTFAVSWIPSSVSGFTHNWAVGVSRGKELEAFRRLNSGLDPFKLDDYFLFGERDAEKDPAKYLRPNFWLYFPTEQTSTFDSPIPVCRRDYIVKYFQQVFPLSDPIPTKLIATMPNSTQPGGQIFLVGKIEGENKGINHIFALWNNNIVGELLYSCITNQYIGIIKIPQNANEGDTNIIIRADYINGEQYVISEANINVSKSASTDYTLPNVNFPQMSIDQVISKYPNIKIFEKGTGFVIFDLRNK